MPPPHSASASASAIATRFATHWVVDALAADESIDFFVLKALLGASSEPLSGVPEATRERVALRSLQEALSQIPAAGDARSGEDVLSRLFREVEISGKLENDLLPPFSQDIKEIIRTKKVTLPETSFQLLKGIDRWILHQPCMPESSSYVPPQEDTTDAVGLGARSPERSPIVDGSMSVGSVLASAGCAAPLQGSISEPFSQQDKHDPTAAVEPKSCLQKSPNLPHCADGEGANDGGSSNQSSKLSSHEGLSAHATVTPGFDRISNVLPRDASEPGQPECITAQDTTMISQPDSRKAHPSALQHERGEKVNQDLEDVSASIRAVEKDHAHGDLTLKFASASIPSSSKDRNRESAKKTSNEDTLEGLSQQVLCIKCGQDGELLTCSDCSLAAHGSCFGPSLTFEETDLFYCPVCYYKEAKKRYLKEKKRFLEAKEKAFAYIGAAQVSKQHDEQLNGVQPGAAERDGHSNGCDLSKRNSLHQNETYDLAHQDEEPHQLRKKQKINAGGNGCPKEVLSEKVPIQNSGPASMNKHSVLQTNSKTRVEDPEKKQQVGDREAGNDNSSHETTASSQRGCDPPSNQDNEADQEDSLTASNQSGGKRSSPPWRNMRHEKESAVPSKSRKGTAKQDPRGKRGSVRPQKRYSNPAGPTGRRKMLKWTEEEVAVLREAMAKFTPKDDAPFQWARMLEYGHHVFNRTRLPLDLRDKWRNLQKKADAGQ